MTNAASPSTPLHSPAPSLRGPLGARAVRIGKVFGIQVGVDASWVVIFLLVTLALQAQLGVEHEAWTGVQRWSAALFGSLLFFLCILLHELGHSVTSNRLGVPVRQITLFLFGGVAKLEKEPTRPLHELAIAVAGPLTSVALGAFFWALSLALASDGAWLGVLAATFGWLGLVNILLAAFNCVPGFPLDGGRMLRALVWGVTGDRDRATLVAATTGRAFAWSLIAGGILLALGFGALLNGLWFVLIGSFLNAAAKGAIVQSAVGDRLERTPVRDVMDRDLPRIDALASVAQLVDEQVLGRGRRWVFVEEKGDLTGLVSLHEIRAVPREERAGRFVRDAMLPRAALVTVDAGAPLARALEQMDARRVNQIPVLQGERIVGVLTRERVLAIVQNLMELRTGLAA